MANIQIDHLGKRYGDKTVLADFSLDLTDGECFTLLGPSGCGKTVLLRLIAGFEKPESGTIRIDGQVVTDAGDGSSVSPDRRGLGMVFQDYAVWPHMSVFDNIAYPLKLAGIEISARRERTLRAIELVGLAGLDARLPSQLSGGQQQRVALARALVSEPRLLLLDEPLNNLDANLREEMRFEIKALQQKLGITILYVTHDQEIALAIADRIAVMDENGRLRQLGTPEEVYERPVDDFVFRFLGIANFLPVSRRDGALCVGDQAGDWPSLPPAHYGDTLTAGFRPGDVQLSRDGAGLTGTIRRASFLGAQFDYLIDIGGALIRTALPSHDALALGLLFDEGDACRVGFHSVQWFDRAIPTSDKV
ncbi:ABC transporter ATP-binding protein [Propionivibrio dicarboxylicus]|uniref:Iron(III) transport system ATP-binding protein n=1 Tax=Propionivibrio dicarboxylicus TaxID=83767 RepID=A0A1G7Y5Y1_9RHOO|nr:ABC transporter ATP-binding protein [Propionivibrio dicarboxylicus]SDG91767.1 iron(III) transport system ATP-binding protein [Propionivibrio dicarboxylicus]